MYLRELLVGLPDYEPIELEVKGDVGTRAAYARDFKSEPSNNNIVTSLYSGYDPETKESYIYIEVRK